MDTSAHLITLALLGLVPTISIVVCRTFLLRVALAVLLGVPPLWARMIYLEQSAADSDFDVVFRIALILWGTALAFYYVLVMGFVGLTQWIWKSAHQNKTNKKTRST